MKKTLLLVLLTAACGEDSRDSFGTEPPPESSPPPPPSFTPPACQQASGGGAPVVYAHAALLYTGSVKDGKTWRHAIAVFDPNALAITEWISLDACKDEHGGFVDMAVDGKGRIFMAGANGLYRIDAKTRECKTIKTAWQGPGADEFHYVNMPNNLTSAPANVFDAAAPADTEVLVGFGATLKNDTDMSEASWQPGFVKIDPETGDQTLVRPYVKDAPEWSLWPSGDLVSVIDSCKKTAITWATVIGGKDKTLCRSCEGTMKAGLDCGDCLYEFDMKTGTFGKNYGILPYDGVFGLTFWGGTLVGFNSKGKIFTVDPTASPLATKEIPLVLPPGVEQVSFMGAGSTTLAPLSGVR